MPLAPGWGDNQDVVWTSEDGDHQHLSVDGSRYVLTSEFGQLAAQRKNQGGVEMVPVWFPVGEDQVWWTCLPLENSFSLKELIWFETRLDYRRGSKPDVLGLGSSSRPEVREPVWLPVLVTPVLVPACLHWCGPQSCSGGWSPRGHRPAGTDPRSAKFSASVELV